jgi:putative aminopeptidase FrvX
MDKIHTHEERISRVDLLDTAKLAVEIIRQCSCR